MTLAGPFCLSNHDDQRLCVPIVSQSASTKSAGPLWVVDHGHCLCGAVPPLSYSLYVLYFSIYCSLQTKSPLLQPTLVVSDGVAPGSAAPTGLGEGLSSGSHMGDPRLSLFRQIGRGSARNRLEACELSSRSGHGSAHRAFRISGVCLLLSGFRPTWSSRRDMA